MDIKKKKKITLKAYITVLVLNFMMLKTLNLLIIFFPKMIYILKNQITGATYC